MRTFSDTVFFVYFASHIPITLLIDLQCILPKWIYPQIVQDVVAWYSVSFKDPLILNPPAWYSSFILCEMFLQLPFFFVATYAFWKGGCRWIRIPALLYGSHVATTVFAIIYHVLVTDYPNTGPESLSEYIWLLSVYAPYLLVPLLLVYVMLTSTEYLPLKSKPH